MARSEPRSPKLLLAAGTQSNGPKSVTTSNAFDVAEGYPEAVASNLQPVPAAELEIDVNVALPFESVVAEPETEHVLGGLVVALDTDTDAPATGVAPWSACTVTNDVAIELKGRVVMTRPTKAFAGCLTNDSEHDGLTGDVSGALVSVNAVLGWEGDPAQPLAPQVAVPVEQFGSVAVTLSVTVMLFLTGGLRLMN
jgi:hypothetical protein